MSNFWDKTYVCCFLLNPDFLILYNKNKNICKLSGLCVFQQTSEKKLN